jgi:hypothetical protein
MKTKEKKNAVFWDVAPCRSCVNPRFGGTYCLHPQGKKSMSEEPALAGGRLQKTAFFIVTALKTSNITKEKKDYIFFCDGGLLVGVIRRTCFMWK